MTVAMVNENFGKRQWVKLWVGEWLDGTTRYEMTGAQRAFWIDLLAMAGRSRQPGIICAGYSGDRVIGYPLTHFKALDAAGELDIEDTLQLFEACGKVRIEVTQEAPIKLIKTEIVNWSKYQSNLAGQAARSRKYRQNKKESSATASRDASRARHAEKSRSVTGVEGEVEGEKYKTSRASRTDVCEELVLFWNQDRGTLPGVLKVTNSRRAKLAARVKADPNFAEIFKRAVLKARQTPFCTGAGGRGWKASFDWFVENDKNYLAVLEGKYDGSDCSRTQPGPMPQRKPSRPELNDEGRKIYERYGVSA